jgi:ubiquinone/menaquinone biosynthesis C-methylase UbiE
MRLGKYRTNAAILKQSIMPANYNNSAWFYDQLSRLVYGKALVNAQVYLLQFIPQNAKILIVGGGTGWILEEINKLHPTGLQITYVEIAAGMIALSKKRNTGSNSVIFINEPIEKVSLPADFDVIITPFLFDNFKDDNLPSIFAHVAKSLKPGGIWLNTDFQLTGKWWQNVLLKTMFLFFKILCRVETSHLPDINAQFKKHGFSIADEHTFFGDFVISEMYRR